MAQRPQWDIDRRLRALIGFDIRVAARAFLPLSQPSHRATPMIPVHDLYLPDNSQPGVRPVYFEGQLERFERRVAVVLVWLGPLTFQPGDSEGQAYVRGRHAVILRGPALVELAYPFRVERIPADADNYWRDLRCPRAQLEFVFSPVQSDGQGERGTVTLPASPVPVD